MKRRVLRLFLSGLLALTLPGASLTAHAGKTTVVDGGTCVYDGSTLKNPSASESSPLTTLTPGSYVTTNVTLKNSSSDTVNAYLSDSVLKNLESGSGDTAASTFSESSAGPTGAAYTYILSYTSAGNTTELYNSDKVSGESGEGLSQAVLSESNDTNGKYYYLGKLASGQSVVVSLTVGLDGETTVNTYQMTNAETAMQFAVERITTNVIHETDEKTEVINLQGENVLVSEDGTVIFSAPRTSDETRLWLFVVILGLCSLGLGICFALKVFPVEKKGRRQTR